MIKTSTILFLLWSVAAGIAINVKDFGLLFVLVAFTFHMSAFVYLASRKNNTLNRMLVMLANSIIVIFMVIATKNVWPF